MSCLVFLLEGGCLGTGPGTSLLSSPSLLPLRRGIQTSNCVLPAPSGATSRNCSFCTRGRGEMVFWGAVVINAKGMCTLSSVVL